MCVCVFGVLKGTFLVTSKDLKGLISHCGVNWNYPKVYFIKISLIKFKNLNHIKKKTSKFINIKEPKKMEIKRAWENYFHKMKKRERDLTTISSFNRILLKTLSKRLELSSMINKLPNKNTIHRKFFPRIFIRDEMLCYY